MANNEIEYKEVTVELPVQILKFLKDREPELGITPRAYITREIIGAIRSDIEAGTIFVKTQKELVEEWDLNPVFEALSIGSLET